MAEAVATGRPVRYLASAQISKEDIARSIASEDGISYGPVLVPVFDSDLSERARVVSTPDGRGGSRLPASRQLFSMDRRLADGATADE